MKKQSVRINNREIELQYDKSEYSIDVSEKDEIISLRRKKDDKVLKVFTDPISFLVQIGKECPSFVVVTWDEKKQPKLTHFVDYESRNYLEKENEFDVNTVLLEEIRLTERSFIVNQNNAGGKIFTVGNGSTYYDRIYKDRRINDIIGKNIVMVDEVKSGEKNKEIEDTLTYGINPDTKEIVTPIWSRLQNRLINLFTNDDIERIRNNRNSMNLDYCDYIYLNNADNSYGLGEATMHFEVDRYIELLENHIEKSDSIYEDDFDSRINENFVNKFVPNKVKKTN